VAKRASARAGGRAAAVAAIRKRQEQLNRTLSGRLVATRRRGCTATQRAPTSRLWRRQDLRKRARDLAVFAQILAPGVTLDDLTSRPDFATCTTRAALLDAIYMELLVRDVAIFGYCAGTTCQHARKTVMRQGRFESNVLHTISVQLPLAAKLASDEGRPYLEKNLGLPATAKRRQRQRSDASRKAKDAQREAKSTGTPPPPQPLPRPKPPTVIAGVDVFSAKGRFKSRFPVMKTWRGSKRRAEMHADIRDHVNIGKVLGDRTSKQTSPLACLKTGQIVDRRDPTSADLPAHWQGPPPPNGYKTPFDPVARCVVHRDKAAALAVAIVTLAFALGLIRPDIFVRVSATISRARATLAPAPLPAQNAEAAILANN
jgi:hypothetical protein